MQGGLSSWKTTQDDGIEEEDTVERLDLQDIQGAFASNLATECLRGRPAFT
jgi:hypothetical protein